MGSLRWRRLPTAGGVLSQRSGVNIYFTGPNHDFKFINYVMGAEQWGPVGNNAGWLNGTAVFSQALGANHYPNTAFTSGDAKAFGGGIWFQPSRVYGDGTDEFYVLRWTGTGTAGFNWANGSSTLQAGLSSNYTAVNSARWSGTNPYIVFRYTGPLELASLTVTASDGTLANIELYRLDEEADRDAGLVYRMDYKNMLVDLCPSWVRFMDWHGSNNCRATRWEYRTPTDNPAFSGTGGNGNSDWSTSPKYGRTSGTNQYTLAGVSGTPSSMLHGEIATFQVASGAVRGGAVSVSAISNGSNGRVTTNSAHGYSDNDIIVHAITAKFVDGRITSGSAVVTNTNNSNIINGMEAYHSYFPAGTTVVSSTSTTITMSNLATASGNVNGETIAYQPMPKLHYQPCQITVVDSTHYDLNIDTTSYGTLSNTAVNANQYISLAVGTGNDRDAAAGSTFDGYPVIFENGAVPATNYGNNYFAANDYKTVIFDKTIAASKDASGNWIYGVWMYNNFGANLGHNAGVPVELCVALINELNDLSPAQAIHMYLNLPHLGHCSMDPDYDADSHYGINCINTVFDGSTVAGKTWEGLAAPAELFLEHSNETWNSAGDGFSQTYYLARRGFFRWQNELNDYISMAVLRSSVTFDDIRQAITNPRIHYILGFFGSQSAGNGGHNDKRMDGTAVYQNDAAVTGNPRLNGVAPMAYPHDIGVFASYIDAALFANWDTANLATLTNSWVSNVGNAVAQEADCAGYVVGLVDEGTTVPDAGSETIGQYMVKLAAYSTKLATYGANKRICQYEGGWDHNVTQIAGGGQGTSGSPYALCTLTASNTTISNMAAGYVSALSVGDFLYGYGLPDGCRVDTKGTTSITVTIAPTISTSRGEILGSVPQQAYLRAVKRSQAWAGALIDWFDFFATFTNAAMPADYIINSRRWGHIHPCAIGFTNNEWGDLDQALLDQGTRNRALPI